MTNRNRGTEERINLITKYLSEKAQFRFNVVTGKIEYKSAEMKAYKEITDYNLNTMCLRLAERNVPSRPGLLKEILESSFTPKYNPFHEYLNNLPEWNGSTDYIQQLANTVVVSDKKSWKEYLQKWLVAMVASMMVDSIINHTVLVLVGGQGVGKSTWFYNLVPESLKQYYYSGAIRLLNKDTLVLLSQSMLINLEELAYLGKAGLNELKEIVTKQQITLRKPYGRFAETLPRRASFAASLNDKEFLVDTTGSRRFLVFEANAIDNTIEYDSSMLFSQVLALFKSGYQYWFDQNEIATLQRHNERYRIKSLEEELLLTTYLPCEKGQETDKLTTSEILHVLHKMYGIEENNTTKQSLGKALRSNGFLHAKRGGKQVYFLREITGSYKQLSMDFTQF